MHFRMPFIVHVRSYRICTKGKRLIILRQTNTFNNARVYGIALLQVLCLTYDGECASNGHVKLLRDRHRYDSRVLDLRFPIGGNGETPVYFGSLVTLKVSSPYSNRLLCS